MSFLKKIFGKKEDINYPEVHDFSWVGVDMHSHLIPGIDDGSKTMEESLDLEPCQQLGASRERATP